MKEKTNTGDQSIGEYSTGDKSTGDFSTGNRSIGDCSTGNRSTGYFSTGNQSTGDYSTGDYSTGDYSTGHWSISNHSTGHFSTIDYSGFSVFNKPCTFEEWEGVSEKPDFLYFNLTKWIEIKDMTDKEKLYNQGYKTTQGYLKVYGYKEAFKKSYNDLSNEQREIQTKQLKALPNFDAEIFKEISGIDISEGGY